MRLIAALMLCIPVVCACTIASESNHDAQRHDVDSSDTAPSIIPLEDFGTGVDLIALDSGDGLRTDEDCRLVDTKEDGEFHSYILTKQPEGFVVDVRVTPWSITLSTEGGVWLGEDRHVLVPWDLPAQAVTGLVTRQGIRIGSTYQEVRAAYGVPAEEGLFEEPGYYSHVAYDCKAPRGFMAAVLTFTLQEGRVVYISSTVGRKKPEAS